MKTRYNVVIPLLAAALLATSTATASAFLLSTSPGKESVFVATVNESLDANGQFGFNADFVKAKANRVLRVDVTVEVTQNASVKGVSVAVQAFTPLSSGVGTPIVVDDCNNPNVLETACSVTTTEWFDIDALEASQPGLWKNQPLTLAIVGGATGAMGAGANRQFRASMSAQLVKK